VRKRIFYAVFIGAAMIAVTSVWAQTMNLTGLTESEAVAIALKNNRDIINAGEELHRADYRITEAESAAYPQINGSWSVNKNLKPQVFVISFPDSTGQLKKNRLKVGTDYNATLGANLTQPLYVGGKVGTALQAAKIYKTISGDTEKNIRQNVVMGTLQLFNGALLARELNRIAGETLIQAQKHLEEVEARKAAGTATEYDLLRARVNVANIRPKLLDSENNARVSLLRLKEIMGVDPGSPIDIKGSFAPPDTTVLEQASGEVALRTRPDVNASRLNIDLYGKAVKIAFGDFLPTLSAGTTFAYNGNFDRFSYNPGDWSPYWFADITLNFPIFTGFKNYAKYKQAKVDYLKARTDYRKTRDSVIIEVEEGTMNFRKALKQIESQRLNVEEAERAVDLAENLYTNGKATQLEVLDAQLALETAKTNMASAFFEGTVAEIALKKSLGLLDVPAK
jgi:outer membrane protein